MAGEELEVYQDNGSWWHMRTWFRWCPTSPARLAEAEKNILSHIWNIMEQKFIKISNGTRTIRTISLNTSSTATPLVLVHGMGSGVGLWVLNLEKLAESRPVYAFDVLGFGRSSRPNLSKDPVLCEAELVESIEDWRKTMKLDKFVMLGHSLGGFISASYALTYPQHLKHLVLVDPWGFPERPTNTDAQQKLPRWIRCLATLLQPFNPLAGLRAAGPLGPGLVNKLRPDLLHKFSSVAEEDTVSQYIYHCNAQQPSGEIAFKTLSVPFGWAKNPIISRVKDLPEDLPMTLVYGSRSWVDNSTGYEIKYLRSDSYVDVQVIKGAGHHVYADRAPQFNECVTRLCSTVDHQGDSSPSSPL